MKINESMFCWFSDFYTAWWVKENILNLETNDLSEKYFIESRSNYFYLTIIAINIIKSIRL